MSKGLSFSGPKIYLTNENQITFSPRAEVQKIKLQFIFKMKNSTTLLNAKSFLRGKFAIHRKARTVKK